MFQNAFDSSSEREIEVLLDGLPVFVPTERRSLTAIRCYLDTLALERQRILYSFCIDGKPAGVARPRADQKIFHRVEGETLELEQLPVQLIRNARQQIADAGAQVQSAVVLVLINDGQVAREFWWELAGKLKEPLMTLSLLPENIFGAADGHASLAQLRRWQLQQLAAVLKEVDEACWSEDSRVLSNALESRALPWLYSLNQLLSLWQETVLAGARR